MTVNFFISLCLFFYFLSFVVLSDRNEKLITFFEELKLNLSFGLAVVERGTERERRESMYTLVVC